MNEKELIKFEETIALLFNQAKIKAPIHLYSGNEKFLIKFFKKIKKNDWVFCSWRSHYQCLLKGVPSKKVKNEIIKGSITSIDNFLKAHELIKVKFHDSRITEDIKNKIKNILDCEIAGSIGKTLILYRQNKDIDKRKIKLSK